MKKELIRTDKNGTKYYHCADRCAKCGGTGYIGHFKYYADGICFDCDGSGVNTWEEKEYTPEYEAKLAAQAEKRAAKKLAAAKAQAAEKNAEFFEKNGFTADGKTYYVLGNTYSIKEELKAQGAKWDNIAEHWHMAVKPEGRDVLEFSVDDVYDKDYAGAYHWNDWKRCEWDDPDYYVNKLKAAEDALKAKKRAAESTSEYVGEVGNKVELQATYIYTATWENNYSYTGGLTHLHTFKDEQGNVFTWKTDKYIAAEYGIKVMLKGTIKDHSEYKGIKQTVLTRCKVTAV